MRILVVADSHYASSDAFPEHPHRHYRLGCELIRRAVEDARRRGGFDVLALMGDLIEAGAPSATEDVTRLAAEVKAAVAEPIVAIPGNHDDQAAVLAAFGPSTALGARQGPGVRDLGGYRFVTFADRYVAGDVCTRGEAGRRVLAEAAAQDGGPIIALQHNPMNPPIESEYPFMLTNRAAVMDDYARAGVLLSISGHYHAGQALNTDRGVAYFTAPCIVESPFRYAILTLDGHAVKAETFELRLPDTPGLIDCHAHTEFAYCGRDISARLMIERAAELGLAGLCLVEHAPQLYCTSDDFFAGRHINEPALWRRGSRERMDQFRRRVLPLAGEAVFVEAVVDVDAAGHAKLEPAAAEPPHTLPVWVGLEVELDVDGQMTLRPEDRPGLDVLLGAVHFLPGKPKEMSDAALEDLFMRTCRGLIAGGIDVLAHPWRYFPWAKRATPTHLYAALADDLAAAGVAAEVNMHLNVNDTAFFRECIARGVKIALGTDAHRPHEAASLLGHLDFLRQAAGRDDVEGLLWRPKNRSR